MARRCFTRREALAAAGTALLAGCAGNEGADQPEAPEKQAEQGAAAITPVDSATWDATYYQPKYSTQEKARIAGEAVARNVEAEGIVLLRNVDDALPLKPGTNVSLLGRSAADTVFGGTGAAGIDLDACVSLREGLEQAGLAVNDVAYDWIASAAPDYPRGAVGQLDRPDTVTHYIGEIPWSDYSSDAQASINGTVGLVFIGRGGGEGGDLSRDLKGDVESGVSENFTANSETANYEDGQHELELTVEQDLRILFVGDRHSLGDLVDIGVLGAAWRLYFRSYLL